MDRADQERSAAYRQMFKTWAWKDFMKEMEQHKEAAVKRLQGLSDGDSTPFKMGEIRGILNEIDQLRKHLYFVTRDEIDEVAIEGRKTS